MDKPSSKVEPRLPQTTAAVAAGDGVAPYRSPHRMTEQDAHEHWMAMGLETACFLVVAWAGNPVLIAAVRHNYQGFLVAIVIFGTILVKIVLFIVEGNFDHHYLVAGRWLSPARSGTIAPLKEFSLANVKKLSIVDKIMRFFQGGNASKVLEDYHTKMAIFSAVRSGDVCLIRGEYIVNLARQRKTMPRRQVSQ
jgi:hypothetical protein